MTTFTPCNILNNKTVKGVDDRWDWSDRCARIIRTNGAKTQTYKWLGKLRKLDHRLWIGIGGNGLIMQDLQSDLK